MVNRERCMNKCVKMVNYKRHIAKTVTWRIIGTLDTIIISGLITGSWVVGLAIGGIETISKMVLYFLHERLWYKFSKFGIKQINNGEEITKNS